MTTLEQRQQYRQSEKGVATRARYRGSIKGKATTAAYNQSDSGKAGQRAYRASQKGKRARAKIDASRRIRRWSDADLTVAQWSETLETFTDRRGTMCAYCYEIVDVPTMDHIDPLALGGSHTAVNVVPACATCNKSKGAKPLLRWMYDKMAVA